MSISCQLFLRHKSFNDNNMVHYISGAQNLLLPFVAGKGQSKLQILFLHIGSLKLNPFNNARDNNKCAPKNIQYGKYTSYFK